MRGEERQQTKPFSYASPKQRNPAQASDPDHSASGEPRAARSVPTRWDTPYATGAGPIRRLAGSAKGEVHLGSWPGGVSKRVMDPWRSRTRR